MCHFGEYVRLQLLEQLRHRRGSIWQRLVQAVAEASHGGGGSHRHFAQRRKMLHDQLADLSCDLLHVRCRKRQRWELGFSLAGSFLCC